MNLSEAFSRAVPVEVLLPTTDSIALVCDSPHSGTAYPADFGYCVATADLRKSEDTYVHWLWDAVPRVGGTLVHATFPRSYIDPNRHENDIDVTMLADPWPGGVAPTARSLALGNGLVSSLTITRQPIYARRLPAHEVAHRIEHYWRPYRHALTQALEMAASNGPRWHLNLHSMPSNAYERLGRVAPAPLADVVLGDLQGRSCSANFTEIVTEAFRQQGYTVAVNEPYAGQDLLRRFGEPSRGHESLQIELNRAIYLDEQTRELLPRASAVREDIAKVLHQIAEHIHSVTAVSS
ncbi:MAG: N-formylglutamate amidohydrolase [Polaromonas sp.]|nr:MAG: N-formylglutamate amidohydrolase [Polaromonas sp.]